MRMLADSVVAINIGNKTYHHWIMTQWTDIVVKYGVYESSSKQNSLKLKVHIDTSAAGDDCGDMVVLIRYKTSFFFDDSFLFVTFGLGDNVPLHYVLG